MCTSCLMPLSPPSLQSLIKEGVNILGLAEVIKLACHMVINSNSIHMAVIQRNTITLNAADARGPIVTHHLTSGFIVLCSCVS